ncbi:hypothetical protein HGRIS_006144 [Hohenbuehelia grisea]|uniref:Uncharacterized protein n=1 Tax=Hohenbuehelia grisea TaxID=104357 RepID=A0ABR3K1J0_9AGAR
MEIQPEWNIKLTLIEPGAFPTAASTLGQNLVDTPAHPAYASPDKIAYMVRQSYKAAEFSGNTKKAAEAVYRLTNLESPPLRLALGKDGIEHIRRKLLGVAADVDTFESWSEDL